MVLSNFLGGCSTHQKANKNAHLDDVHERWLGKHGVCFNLHTCKCVLCLPPQFLDLCNILLNLLLLLLKDVDMHYNKTLRKQNKLKQQLFR